MKKTTLRFRTAITLLAVLLSAMTAALLFLDHGQASAQDAAGANGYYYQQLSPEGQRFYNAIGDMEESGLLKTGNGEYDLIGNGVLTQAQLNSFATSSDVMIAFGAARDAYRLDHPEVFYIDFDYLSVSVGTQNGSYVATLGTGRAASYYIADGFASESQVNAAIAALDAEVTAVAAEADRQEGTVEKIRSVNAQLVEKITYSFCATADASGTTYGDGAAYIRNPYGALVNGKAVCEGYARAFKLVMDRLGVECVLVQGVAQGETNGGYEPHMWNYVKLDGGWYAVDVTWNDTAGKTEDYFLRGNAVMKLDHVTDGVVSECNYEFTYPALAAYDYGVTVDPNGISIEEEYQDNSTMVLTVSYDGKGAERLAEEDGLYLVYRYRQSVDGVMSWGVWIYLGGAGGENYDTYSQTLINSYIQYIQFAIVDYAPDTYNWYSGEIDDKHIGQYSEPHVNNAFGSYFAPPYVQSITPSNQLCIGVGQSYEVTVTYTDNLKLADETKGYGVVFSSQHADIGDYARVENVRWDSAQPNVLKFTFTPSQMFNHRYETYSFFVVNLVGEESGKEPNAFSFMTEQQSVACSKIYGDGRLYIKSYGEPSLVGAGDLSMTGWQTEDGAYVSENQRSQLALVVTKPAESEAMVENATAEYAEGAVKASETYELELDLCSHIVKIPDGSFMQVAFGFPAGYGPDDAGVTFKVYHFKRGADGEIDYSLTEELECVITEYGLIVTVTDFSPFAVVALDRSAVTASGKGIYARTVGLGGSVEGDGVTLLKEGEVTYRFVPESGYRLDRVLLNGVEQQCDGNTLTLAYADLNENNTLLASFVAESVAQREESEGITNVYPMVNVVGVTAGNGGNTGDGNGTGDGNTGNGSGTGNGNGAEGGNTESGGEGGKLDGTLLGVIAVCAVAAVCIIAAAVIVAVKKRRP